MKKIELNMLELKGKTTYNDGNIAIINDLNELSSRKGVYKTDFFIILLCLNGKITLHIDGNPYIINENDLLVCPPNVIIGNNLLSDDFKYSCICLSTKCIQKIMPLADNNWEIGLFFERHPQISLNSEEVSTFLLYYDLFCSRLKHSSEKHFKKIINTLIQAFLYEFHEIVKRVFGASPRHFSSYEQHFKSFIDILSSSYPRNRNIAFYADKLCITPKYLSTVCKRAMGQSASKIIREYVVKDIEYLLKHTQKNIKDISNELNFPNVAFFGKYVKSSLGNSPKALREQFINGATEITQLF